MTVLQDIRQVGAALCRRRHALRSEHARKVCAGAVIILALCRPASMSAASGVGGYSNASVASPVRSATVPLSSYQNGLVARPNPIDNSSNRVVTGNVAAGKHFRGSIPYRSTTSLDTPLGSTSLDSFMRYTAMSQTPGLSAGTYSPYDSATRTASTIPPGTRSVLAPGPSVFGTSVAPPPVLPPRIVSTDDADAVAGDSASSTLPPLRLWPQSRTPDPAANGASNGRAARGDHRVFPQSSATLTADEYQRQMELLRRRLGEVRAELAEMDRAVAADDESAQPAEVVPLQDLTRREQLLEETARLMAATTALPSRDVTALARKGSDAETRLQLYDPSRQTPRSQGAVGTAQSLPAGGLFASERAKRAFDAPTPLPKRSSADLSGPHVARTPVKPDIETSTPIERSTAVERPVRKADEKVAVASHKAFASHLVMAEKHLQQGRYAQAAESFALASAYLPNNARAYLGKSHALLATGRYTDSALALARAIELDSRDALKQVDLVRIVGGPDAFVARFNELDEAIETGQTPQLQFLLAYICHQMGRPQEARVAVEAARRTLPSSVPVDLLRRAIGP